MRDVMVTSRSGQGGQASVMEVQYIAIAASALIGDTAGAIEGDRRLMYVGVTRASRALWLSRPRVRQTRFGSRGQKPSRFLSEMGFREVE